MKQGTKDAIKGGFIVFILFDLPLFFIGLFSNTMLLINFDFLTITPYVYFILPIIGSIIFFIGGKIKGKKRGRSIFVSKGPPALVLDDLMLNNVFGVNWRIQVGMGTNDYEFYVEGNFCPKCNCKLMSKTKNIFFGWSNKNMWNCPSCGFEIERPKDYLYYEEDAVENIAKNQYEKQKRR